MKILFGLFVLLCITNIYQVWSQKTIKNTNCKRFGSTDVRAFNQTKYMGFWYIAGAFNYPDIAGRDCLTSNYTEATGRNATILESSKDLTTNQTHIIHSNMVFDSQGAPNYIYIIPAENVDNWPVEVLATDYDSFSIEWTCKQNGSASDCYIWIMSRYRKFGIEFWVKINPILKRHNISKTNLRIIKQGEDVCSN